MGAKALSTVTQLMSSNDSLNGGVVSQLAADEALQAKLDGILQLKPCVKHAWTGSKACPTCKVEKSNKNHNPRAGVSGDGASASGSLDRDDAMANKDGQKSRKELNREFRELNK